MYTLKLFSKKILALKWLHNYLYNKLMFNGFLRAFITGYIVMCFSNLVVLKNVNTAVNLSDWKSVMNTCITIVLLFIVLISPLLSLLFFNLFRRRLDDKDFKLKFSAAYHGAKLKDPKTHYINFIFLARRLMFALIAVYMGPEMVSINLMINTTMSLTYLIYLLHYRPMKKSFNLKLEIFNEFTFLLCLDLCYCFTVALSDYEQKFWVGWAFVGLVVLNILVGSIAMIKKLIVTLKKKWKENKKWLNKICNKGKIKIGSGSAIPSSNTS